jgi:FkbM family methyltransferase
MREISQNHQFHAKSSTWYQETWAILEKSILDFHGPDTSEEMNLAEIGKIAFPYFSMGNIDSIKLFGMDEIILFSFYYTNCGRYKKVLDLGANIGLHSLVLRLMGFEVESYEPDPIHIQQIKKVLRLNNLEFTGINEAAVSSEDGELEFLRILGNTTGSHLAGSKPGDPYGEVDRFKVKTVAFNSIMNQGFDLVKMDVEGHEAQLLESLDLSYLQRTDIMLEVGSTQNAERIFKVMSKTNISMYAQKLNWGAVLSLEDMPTSHREGSLFISIKDCVPWE